MSQPMGVIAPPEGIIPDFENPVRKAQYVYVLSGIGMALSTAFMIMRVYTKAHINRTFASEDVCVILAWVFSIATVAEVMLGFLKYGSGTHLWEVTPSQFATWQKVIMSASVIYVPAQGFAKTSILLMFRRISPQKGLRMAIYTVLAVVIGYSIALILVLIFACNPIERAWDGTITEGFCINRNAVYVATAVVNIVTDLAIIAIPIPMVINLKMPLQQKIGLAFMFAIGSLTCVTSIVRLVELIPMLSNPDATWAVAVPAVWIVVEANLQVICCCFLSLKAFLRRHAPILIGERSTTGGGYRSGGSKGSKGTKSTKSTGVIVKDVSFNLSWHRDKAFESGDQFNNAKYVEMGRVPGKPPRRDADSLNGSEEIILQSP